MTFFYIFMLINSLQLKYILVDKIFTHYDSHRAKNPVVLLVNSKYFDFHQLYTNTKVNIKMLLVQLKASYNK